MLGAGGGGDPYIGLMQALQATEDFGLVTLVDLDELPDEGLIIKVKLPPKLFTLVPSAKKIVAVVPGMLGPFTMLPIVIGTLMPPTVINTLS